jgi:predicted outer membrane lipoprotein
VILVGEKHSRVESEGTPAFGADRASGHRLRLLLGGVDPLTVMSTANLLPAGEWSPALAREAAESLLEATDEDRWLLAGRRVATAFGLVGAPWLEWVESADRLMAVFPHPSGLNHWWNDPRATARAKAFLRRSVRGG